MTNPEQLFDYLDGSLPDYEREKLESELLTDSHLQKQLAIARRIHKGMPGSREIAPPMAAESAEARKAGVLGRRVAVAFAALFLLNVLVGIGFIVVRNERPSAMLGDKEAAVRKQLQASLQNSAAAALPVPTLANDVVTITAASTEYDVIAEKVTLAARQSGGSVTKSPVVDESMTIFAEIPGEHESQFRNALTMLGATNSAPASPNAGDVSPGPEKKTIRIRLAGTGRDASP